MKASIMTAKETLRAILLNQIAMGMPNKTIQDSPEQNKKDFTHTLNMFERQLWLLKLFWRNIYIRFPLYCVLKVSTAAVAFHCLNTKSTSHSGSPITKNISTAYYYSLVMQD